MQSFFWFLCCLITQNNSVAFIANKKLTYFNSFSLLLIIFLIRFHYLIIDIKTIHFFAGILFFIHVNTLYLRILLIP